MADALKQELPRYDDETIRLICRKIIESKDATDFAKKALLWLIGKSENLSKLVYTATTGREGGEMSIGVHNMNSSLLTTQLSTYVRGVLGVNIYFCGWLGGQDEKNQEIYTIRIMQSPATDFADLEFVPFDSSAISAIMFCDYCHMFIG